MTGRAVAAHTSLAHFLTSFVDFVLFETGSCLVGLAGLELSYADQALKLTEIHLLLPPSAEIKNPFVHPRPLLVI